MKTDNYVLSYTIIRNDSFPENKHHFSGKSQSAGGVSRLELVEDMF